jgi:hypothetical protein
MQQSLVKVDHPCPATPSLPAEIPMDIVYNFAAHDAPPYQSETAAGRFAAFFARHLKWRRVENIAYRSHRSLDPVRQTLAVHLCTTVDIPLLVGAQNVLLRTSRPTRNDSTTLDIPRSSASVRVLQAYIPLTTAPDIPVLLPPARRIVDDNANRLGPSRTAFVPLSRKLNNRRLIDAYRVKEEFSIESSHVLVPWNANLDATALRRFIEALSSVADLDGHFDIIITPVPGASFKDFSSGIAETFRRDGLYPHVFVPEKSMDLQDWGAILRYAGVLVDLGCDGESALLYADALDEGTLIVSATRAKLPSALDPAMAPSQPAIEALRKALTACHYGSLLESAHAIHRIVRSEAAMKARNYARQCFEFDVYRDWFVKAIMD